MPSNGFIVLAFKESFDFFPLERYLIEYNNREDFDQTAHMCSLIRTFSVCITMT